MIIEKRMFSFRGWLNDGTEILSDRNNDRNALTHYHLFVTFKRLFIKIFYNSNLNRRDNSLSCPSSTAFSISGLASFIDHKNAIA